MLLGDEKRGTPKGAFAVLFGMAFEEKGKMQNNENRMVLHPRLWSYQSGAWIRTQAYFLCGLQYRDPGIDVCGILIWRIRLLCCCRREDYTGYEQRGIMKYKTMQEPVSKLMHQHKRRNIYEE